MLIQITYVDNIGIIEFQNDPLNLLSIDFINQLNYALNAMETNDAVRVIMLNSNKKVFCAGANVKELLGVVKDHSTLDGQDAADPIENWQRLAEIKKPIVACVGGACLGGGLEIALMCDFIVASENARFGFPEIKLGLLPGGGGTQRILDRINLNRAKELLMFGDTITSETALNWGLVNAVFADDEYYEKALDFAAKLAAQSVDSLKAIKYLVSLSTSESLQQRLKTERKAFYERLKSSDAQDRIGAFFNRKK